MNRRMFLRALGLAPLAVPLVAAVKPEARAGKVLAFDASGAPRMTATEVLERQQAFSDELDTRFAEIFARSAR